MIYRDGVGDGDLQYVTGHEVAQLQSCFASFGEAYQPKMAVIVVQKRINTRVFLRTVSVGQLCYQAMGVGSERLVHTDTTYWIIKPFDTGSHKRV